jgi:hypothetical protein
VSGGHAFVADGDSGLQVVDIDPASGSYLTIVGSLVFAGARDVAVSGQTAYVAIGANGLQIIDISDPEHPGRY